MRNIESVAIIDDDNIYQFTAKRAIEWTGLIKKIYTFPGAKEALDYFSENMHNEDQLPDIIFLDLNMPVMDGWQFLKEFVLLKPQIKKKSIIYIVTSSINPEDMMRAKNISDVTEYIVKPMTIEKFKSIIDSLDQY